MQRLTLILSDLYLPGEGRLFERAGGGFPQTRELPALSELLSVSREPETVGDWRSWLLRELGGRREAVSLAALCAPGIVRAAEAETAWLATPVALEARLDHVRMVDRGLLTLDAAERAACCEEFNRVFGPQYSLSDGGERAFILGGLAGSMPIADPARLLGDEIGPALRAADAAPLRRLWSEIEMWLHGSAFNEARDRARRRRVSALWLWGRHGDTPGALEVDPRRVEIYGGDPLVGGLSRMQQSPWRDAPQDLAQLEGNPPHAVVEFAVLTGHAHEALAELETRWFAAARHALASGTLPLLEIVANDRRFRITPRARWRFWRRRRGWLETLAD
jgi:hypothetical protein